MGTLFSFMWGFIGIIFVFAGKPFIEVAACFLICGVFMGAAEVYELRRFLNGHIVYLKQINLKELAKEDEEVHESVRDDSR